MYNLAPAKVKLEIELKHEVEKKVLEQEVFSRNKLSKGTTNRQGVKYSSYRKWS